MANMCKRFPSIFVTRPDRIATFIRITATVSHLSSPDFTMVFRLRDVPYARLECPQCCVNQPAYTLAPEAATFVSVTIVSFKSPSVGVIEVGGMDDYLKIFPCHSGSGLDYYLIDFIVGTGRRGRAAEGGRR
jgi:hypothetical protein